MEPNERKFARSDKSLSTTGCSRPGILPFSLAVRCSFGPCSSYWSLGIHPSHSFPYLPCRRSHLAIRGIEPLPLLLQFQLVRHLRRRWWRLKRQPEELLGKITKLKSFHFSSAGYLLFIVSKGNELLTLDENFEGFYTQRSHQDFPFDVSPLVLCRKNILISAKNAQSRVESTQNSVALHSIGRYFGNDFRNQCQFLCLFNNLIKDLTISQNNQFEKTLCIIFF